jgi:hypothetical protein
MTKLIVTFQFFQTSLKTESYFLMLLSVSAHNGHPQIELIYKGMCLFFQRYIKTGLIHSTVWK